MAWCPKCRHEYREGITVCGDCNVELVDSLTEADNKPLIFGDREQMGQLKEFLEYNGLQSITLQYDENEDVYEIYAQGKEKERAAKAIAIFLQQEAMREAEIEPEESREDKSAQKPSVYQKKADKAEDFKTSAATLLVVGIAGLLALVLIYFGVIPFPVSGMNMYMIYGVMGVVFILFIVMGVMSVKSFKTLAKEAANENQLTEQLLKWSKENLTLALIDEGLFQEKAFGEDTSSGISSPEISEEMRYFARMEKMKELISNKFMNLDEEYLDKILDDYYQKMLEDEA